MFIVLVHRKEAETGMPIFGNPFDGIEVLGVFGNLEAANAEIDKYINNGHGWSFHIDEAKPDLSVL